VAVDRVTSAETSLTLLGVTLAGIGIAVPWYGLALSLQGPSSGIQLMVAGRLFPVWLSAQAVVAVGMVAAVGSLIVRSRRSLLCHLAALFSLLPPVAFLLQSRYSDARFRWALETRSVELRTITSQLAYRISLESPSSVLGFRVGNRWTELIAALRLGWAASVAGGVVLVVVACRKRPRRRPLAWVPGGLAAFVLVPTVIVGLRAQAAMSNGGDELQMGRPAAAMADFRQAVADDGRMAWDPDLLTGEEDASVAEGADDTPLALIALSDDARSQNQLASAVADIDAAISSAPDDPVIEAAVLQRATALSLSRGDPSVLLALPAALTQNSVPATYTLGRLYYSGGDDQQSIRWFTRTLAISSDGDVRSSCFTYLALSEMRLGAQDQSRSYLEMALRADPLHNNATAEALAAGLYEAGVP